MSKPSTKCRCGQKDTKGICRNCSAIKMVFLLKHGWNVYQENGKNPVRYNYVKTNRQPIDKIITDMVRRLIMENPLLQQAINVIQVYDNQNNTLITEFK